MAFLTLSPTRDGIHYKAIPIDGLIAPVFALNDPADPDVMIDLRSVARAVGVSWPRWNLLLRAQRTAWQLDSCLDRDGLETELIPARKFLAWLANMQPVMAGHSRRVAENAKRLRGFWRVSGNDAIGEHWPERIATGAAARNTAGGQSAIARGRPPKVSAQTVSLLYHSLVAGNTLKLAAVECGIGVETARKVIAGTCKSMDSAALTVWERSFLLDPDHKGFIGAPNKSVARS